MRSNTLRLCLGLLLCLTQPVHADVATDGLDDRLASGIPITTFLTPPNTGTLLVWFRPLGTAGSTGTACYAGDVIAGDDDPAGVDYGYLWLVRNANLAGNDRFCAFHNDGAFDQIIATYTVGAWTHLALTLGGGSMSLYKDGVLVQTVASGTTVWQVPSISSLSFGDVGANPTTTSTEGRYANAEMFASVLPQAEIRSKAEARLHDFGTTGRTGAWGFDSCVTTANAHVFYDRSGNGRTLTGNDGPGNTGLTCMENTVLTYGWGVE